MRLVHARIFFPRNGRGRILFPEFLARAVVARPAKTYSIQLSRLKFVATMIISSVITRKTTVIKPASAAAAT